jgi:hypothetical protein
MPYIKARFTHPVNGPTAGLVVAADTFSHVTVSDFSRLFPKFESRKMLHLEVSPRCETWEDAFLYSFEMRPYLVRNAVREVQA